MHYSPLRYPGGKNKLSAFIAKICIDNDVNGHYVEPYSGGASVALAETLGSIASLLVVNQDLFIGVGIEINANHVKAVTQGIVTGVCKPLHIKGKTHVWEIKIYNEAKEMTCVSRFTCAIVSKQKMQEKMKSL